MSRQKRVDSQFDAVRLIRETILPAVLDADPSEWIASLWRMRDESGLTRSQKEAVWREGKIFLKERKMVVNGIERGVETVRGLDGADGLPLRNRFLGVLLFGGITGKSYGKPSPDKALHPAKLKDADIIPVVNGILSGSRNYDFMRRRLQDAIEAEAEVFPQVFKLISVGISEPDFVRGQVQNLRETELRHLDPRPWHFIGDEATKKLFTEALEKR